MQTNIDKYRKYLIVAGNGNSLNRYVVSGEEVKQIFNKFERVCYIGLMQCFECYTKCPETGQTGWNIIFIEGVKEKIEKLYPDFDCFITEGYPTKGKEYIEYYHYDNDDYTLSQL